MRLLVANRGEIAVRIIATAATAGIGTVAVYPDDDASCAHVARAEEAVRLPGAGPAAYLDVEEIVAAARRTGCDALHPGYGFLSENAGLARACAEDGIRFVGPSPASLELFGDKTAAREHARGLGVPVPEATADPAAARALVAGGPVMVKARAGGGGRGMRPVTRPEDLDAALRTCASEARSAFGDDAVYVERLLPHVRHVEVQVLGDGHDAVVLGDRDCSAQRRRQKLVEIAPAPALPAKLRARLHQYALRLVSAYSGLATVEFLLDGDEVAFLEVNPRIQVEHTVTEEVTGLDLVELGLRVADGARLADLDLTTTPPSRDAAVQARVNTETLLPDGTVLPGTGTLERFQPPTGRGVRVDTHGYVGYEIGPRYDPLLAKVIVTGSDAAAAAARAARALGEFDVAGVPTTIGLLRALLARPELVDGRLHTTFVDGLGQRCGSTTPTGGDPEQHQGSTTPTRGGPDQRYGSTTSDGGGAGDEVGAVASPQHGVVVAVSVALGDAVAAGAEIVVVEAMKMEHAVRAERAGVVEALAVKVGDVVPVGTPVAYLTGSDDTAADPEEQTAVDPDHVRADLAETLDRRRAGLDDGRPEAVERRHAAGRRTARETLAALLDPDSFVEYGALTIAAQRRRRSLDDLVARTPADGLITGTGTVDGAPVAVMIYDYTVLAGTQGVHNHRKTDRLFAIAARHRLPLVIFAEGGGGRPGDTDTAAVASLDVPSFRDLAELRGRVPTLAVVAGYCFAGNAALAGVCDTIIATEGSSLGMGGPAMISGGGLGDVEPGDVGPMDVQWAGGVVDRLVPDDDTAVADARRWLSYVTGRGDDAVDVGRAGQGAVGPRDTRPAPVAPTRSELGHADQRRMRQLVPENRLRAYPVRPVLETLVDTDSLFELRGGFGAGIVTALARLDGRPVGVLANNPEHLGGAIDGDAADKAAAFLRLCESHRLPVVSLCDTPGFMVGPDAERTATVRRFGDMFVAGARLTTPLVLVVLRKSYGLGAMAMAGGSLHAPALSVSWPTGEFGGMGLEGAVRLGYRTELDAIDDLVRKRARFDELVADYYERGKALSVATVFEIDDVVDPADTRDLLTRTLTHVS